MPSDSPFWIIEVFVSEGQIGVRAQLNRAATPSYSWFGASLHDALRELEQWLSQTPHGRYSVTVKAPDGRRAWSTTASHFRVAAYFVLTVFERELVDNGRPMSAAPRRGEIAVISPRNRTRAREARLDPLAIRDSAVISKDSLKTYDEGAAESCGKPGKKR